MTMNGLKQYHTNVTTEPQKFVIDVLVDNDYTNWERGTIEPETRLDMDLAFDNMEVVDIAGYLEFEVGKELKHDVILDYNPLSGDKQTIEELALVVAPYLES